MKTLPLASVLLVLAIPAQAAELQIAVDNPVVELTISETVVSAPDVATLGAGVSVRAQTVSAAMRENAARMEKVIEQLKASGIKREDIQTSGFSLNSQYQYRNDGREPTFLGYDVSNQITVKLHDLAAIGKTYDTLASAGANNFFGPNFGLEKDEPVRDAGRKAAFSRGQLQAADYARMAGYSGARLLEVSETYAVAQPYSGGSNTIIVTGSSRNSVTPIEPGQVGTSVTVTMKFEMTR